VAEKARAGQTRETGALSAERAEGRAARRHRAIEAIARKGDDVGIMSWLGKS
jgi:hypothetical protein